MKFPIEVRKVQFGVVVEYDGTLYRVVRYDNYGGSIKLVTLDNRLERFLSRGTIVYVLSSKRKMTTSGKRWNDKYKQKKYQPNNRRSRTRK